jgi:hypothetical protein
VDGFPEYKIIQKRVDALEREMATLRTDVDALLKDNRGFRADLDRLVFLLIGDEEMGLPGVVERIKALDATSGKIKFGQVIIGFLSASTLLAILFHGLL